MWASASEAVSTTRAPGSRHHAHEVLAALRDRIETTPWRGERGRTALRVLRAHLNLAEIAGGPLHHASERQTAEEAGISRTTLRVVYETVLKPRGRLRRLRVGHGREGSTVPPARATWQAMAAVIRCPCSAAPWRSARSDTVRPSEASLL
ncbi:MULTISPECIES: hypothetical protein [Streptomyces]|uniref:GntR family transcriptional regulator n=1 Tax=Streptomyces lutosisoli TaxID=2665721 RepID=A0ABW2VZ07_9ACTN